MSIYNGMRAIHPGEILFEEYMQPLNLSSNALAKELGLSVARINEIKNGKRGITAETALILSKYFGTTAQSWLNLQNNYDLKIAAKNSNTSKKLAIITPRISQSI